MRTFEEDKFQLAALLFRATAKKSFKPARLSDTSTIVMPDQDGRFVFSATDATLHGTNLKLEEKGGKPDIG